jgi:hypothetical protein
MASIHPYICPSLKLFKKLTMRVEKCILLRVVGSAKTAPGILLPFTVKKLVTLRLKNLNCCNRHWPGKHKIALLLGYKGNSLGTILSRVASRIQGATARIRRTPTQNPAAQEKTSSTCKATEENSSWRKLVSYNKPKKQRLCENLDILKCLWSSVRAWRPYWRSRNSVSLKWQQKICSL